MPRRCPQPSRPPPLSPACPAPAPKPPHSLPPATGRLPSSSSRNPSAPESQPEHVVVPDVATGLLPLRRDVQESKLRRLCRIPQLIEPEDAKNRRQLLRDSAGD